MPVKLSKSTSDLETKQEPSLDGLADQELEDILFEEEKPASDGMFNLPTLAGLGLVGLGILYLMQQLGLLVLPSLSGFLEVLPVLAGILAVLLGFGLLSRKPRKKRRRKRSKRDLTPAKSTITTEKKQASRPRPDPPAKSKRKRNRLYKSRERKISGVCGGLADVLGIDVSLVRIAFAVSAFPWAGCAGLVAYVLLSLIMREPDEY